MNVQEATTEPPRGNNFGKYRLIASVGHGGMADVYLAALAGPAGVTKLQVVKRLRQNLAEEPDFLSMFLDEARLAARLNHPNVVQTNEVGEVDSGYFIAMEYLDGQPLNRILHAGKTRPAPPGLCLQIIAEALAGLHYAHELTDYDGTPLAIVHRDTSPHNIFVTYEGQTKLVDFGIAKASRRATETNVGVVKGKFMYMSPEQAMSADVDRRSDIFVMGLVLWEVVAGRRMWKGLADNQVIARLIAGDLPRLADACPGAPPGIARICDHALAHKPSDRYATAAAMRRDILAYLDEARLNVGAETMREYLSAVFADKRADMKKIIEQQLSGMAKSPNVTAVSAGVPPTSSSLPDLGTGATGREMEFTPSRTRQTPLAALSNSSVVGVLLEQPRRRIGLAGAALFLGGALVIALGTYAGLARRSAAPVAAPVEAQATSPTNAPAHGTTAAKIELRVHAEPESARIFLDDAALPTNPFTGHFAVDDLTHRLRVEAPGHATRTQLIVFAKDAAVDVTLAPTTAAPPVVHRGRGRPPPAAAEPSVATASSPATPATPTTPTTPTKEKRSLEDPWGDGAKPSAAPKRSLDSADPFH